jgi:hypothetical protein
VWRKVGLLLTMWAVSIAVSAAKADDLVGLPDGEFSEGDLAATSVPPPDSAVDGERQRLLAMGADQGLHRRQPQRIDTPAWMRSPFEGAVLALAGEDFPLGSPPPESVDIILMSLPDPVAPVGST